MQPRLAFLGQAVDRADGVGLVRVGLGQHPRAGAQLLHLAR